MKTKDEIQAKIINTIIKKKLKGIVLSSVRSGKTRILLETVRKHSKDTSCKLLVLYPNIDIKNSWTTECDLIDYHPDITYSTFASIEKVKDLKFDYIIIDEAHLLGEDNQLPAAAYLSKRHKNCIFASGTYSDSTLDAIKLHTGLEMIVNYSTDDAIADGIVSDFNVYIHKYKLDGVIPVQYGKTKKWMSTEVKECNRLTARVTNSYGKEKMFHALSRMRFINSTNSLTNKVNDWIYSNKDSRFLLFASDEKMGLKYKIPMFNSKSKDDEVLQNFQSQKINQLCLIKKGSAGITYLNLQNILITAINSNGENLEQMLGRALLTDTENANIHIFVSEQEFQLKWLNSSLLNVNKSKIKYV